MFRDLLDYFMHIEVEPFSRDITTTWCFPPILCYRQQERLKIVNALNLIYFLTFSTNNYCCFLLGIYLSKWLTLMTWNALKKMYESLWNYSALLLNAVQSMLDHWDYQMDQWKTSQQWAISNNVRDDPQKGCFQTNRRFPHCWLTQIAGKNGKTQRFSQRYLIQARQLYSLPVINSRIGKTRFGLNSRAKDQNNS